MKCISWNVNGLRAVMKKDFLQTFASLDADIFCIQETKMQEGQAELDLPGYEQYFSYAEKKGYSGTAVFTRRHPLRVTCVIGVEEHDHEGRVITLEFEDLFFITVYTPNSQDGLRRLDYRMRWEDDFLAYVKALDRVKPVVWCGDLNHMNAGFTDEERAKMTAALDSGFIDTFRYFYPDQAGVYSWWSYRFHARENNAGWRIDYFICSESLKDRLKDARIHTEVMGSDHCPVELDIE